MLSKDAVKWSAHTKKPSENRTDLWFGYASPGPDYIADLPPVLARGRPKYVEEHSEPAIRLCLEEGHIFLSSCPGYMFNTR